VDELVEVTGAGLLEEEPLAPPDPVEALDVLGEEYITTGGAAVGTVPPAMFTTRNVGEGMAIGPASVGTGVAVAVCSIATGTTTWGGWVSLLILPCFCLLRSCTDLFANRLHIHTVPVRAPDTRNNLTEVAIFLLFSMISSRERV
jgi:hypothetical protein